MFGFDAREWGCLWRPKNGLRAADPGQGEIKGRAFVFFGLSPDAAAVPQENAMDVGQPDAGAFEFLFEVQALKDAEEFANVLHIKTYTIVADKDNELLTGVLRADFDASGIARAGVFDGISDQICEY